MSKDTNTSYKFLLAGQNQAVMDDFFVSLEDIEPVTTSLRWQDMLNHVKNFKPDVFVYCVENETPQDVKQMVSLKLRLEKERIPFVLIGSEEDCANFKKNATASTADLILKKPLESAVIEQRIIQYIDVHLKQEELRQEEEKLKRTLPHILVIDDDSTMLKTIKEQLKDEYNVATAINGKIALKFLESKTTDLILLDYEMPGEKGPDILKKLRENESTKETPVIFLTGVTEREKIAQVLSLKPQGYLLKHIEHEKLMEAIKAVLPGEDKDA